MSKRSTEDQAARVMQAVVDLLNVAHAFAASEARDAGPKGVNDYHAGRLARAAVNFTNVVKNLTRERP